jgi:hypothetical protein
MNVKKELSSQIFEEFEKLKNSLKKELLSTLMEVIKQNANLNIYSIGVYTNTDSWSYCHPTFSSEEGLMSVAKKYILKNDQLSLKDAKTMLRWSHTDSPHLSEEKYDQMLPETNKCLNQIATFINQLDYEQFPESWESIPEDPDEAEEAWQVNIGTLSLATYQFILNSLIECSKSSEISNFLSTSKSLLCIAGGDQSEEMFCDTLSHLHSADEIDKYKKESDAGMKIFNKYMMSMVSK